MAFYDKYGNEIDFDAEITDEEIREAFISAIADGTINPGVTIGATLSVQTYSSAWETNAMQAYNSLLEAYRTKPNRSVPFFISTDQHGSGLQQHRYVNNVDVDGMNIININLGDTVQDIYAESTIRGFWDVTKQVKNYMAVVGNHDVKHGSDRMYELTLGKSYSTTNLLRKNPSSKCDCYVIDDTPHAVRWVVLEDYYINADGTGYTHGFDSETVDWLIAELSKNDMDCIIVMHWPSAPTFRNREQTEERSLSSSWGATTELVWNFFLARKNKTSGTFTDINGVAHSYDFTGCEKELLCTLHGHLHSEEWSVKYGLTAYAADRYNATVASGTNCVFGMVDRDTNKLRIWRFNATQVFDELQLSI